MVEGVQSLKPELQSLVFGEEEFFVKIEVHVGIAGTANVPYRTSTELVGRMRDVTRIKPLDKSWRRRSTVYSLVDYVNRAIAIRPCA